ncbi:protein translocase subunit SecDF [Mucilaginibacter polytrichastri]|uniref:Multifunctional fusion protein n=1 Tax=Mucilaginibacter polytrichastri TaxID=1302689 RepID=A0A1Q5ZUL7_9SPHI|nr:protein translocase subunit SecDF [Mucilaginibacter polytrichastri]OKS85460.1 Protein translocase subunit SecD [Mucilaginibacter polytrichastri]SFS38478.1 SecD/SecF fusion protein [Mucilaginibacter polytrichastri]
MQGKGVIKFFAILLAIVCLYQLSFTWVTRKVESDAKDYAKGNTEKEKAYLDSISSQPVYPLLKHTYQYCKDRELALGLDLKGGMNVTMQISLGELIKSLSDNNQDPAFKQALSKAEIDSHTSPENYISLFMNEYKKISPDGKLAPIFATKENQEHIKFNSSNSEVESYLKDQASTAVTQSYNILTTRIDKFGVTAPNIQLQEGTNRILVELPGVTEKDRVRKLLQGSAKLEFYETGENAEIAPLLTNVNSLLAAKIKAPAAKDTAKTAALAGTDAKKDSTKGGSLLSKVQKSTTKDTSALGKTQALAENPLFAVLAPSIYQGQNGQAQYGPGPVVGRAAQKDTAKIDDFFRLPEVKAIIPPNLKFLWSVKPIEKSKVFELYAIKLSGAGNGPVLTGDVITDANADVNQSQGGFEVTMDMSSEGATKWREITAAAAGNANDPNDNRSIAIVLDDNVVSAPRVSNEISGGRSSISGNFTQEETKDLANILKAGRLPAPARIVAEDVVGASLGAEAIHDGLMSCVIGLVVVLVFMIVYYNRAGTVAVVAVFINVFFLMGVLTNIGAVLTLPGVAGIVLILGISVDANVLIYERVREEMALGKSLRLSIEDGFKHALSSILDSNISTFITGLILFIFGTGPVQGFATTLMIGIVTSLFCSLLISRLIFEWMLGKGWDIKFSNPWSSHTFKGANYAFVKNRFRFYAFSGIFIFAGIISMFTRGFSYGVDFRGGRSYVVRFDKEVNIEGVRSALTETFGEGKTILKTYVDNKGQVGITTDYMIDDNSTSGDGKVEATLRSSLSKVNPKFQIVSQQKVGPTIANSIKTSAIWTVIFAILVISVYILIRFRRWQFSLGAMIATAHDALLVLSFFSLFYGYLPFSLDIDQNFIAAILTVIGYSINDTVVVFDRIREFLDQNKGKGEDQKVVINRAINSTLSRTIITALTVIFVLVVLFIFGGDVIRGFSFALLIGVCFGTYSSICVATPVIVDFGRKHLK